MSGETSGKNRLERIDQSDRRKEPEPWRRLSSRLKVPRLNNRMMHGRCSAGASLHRQAGARS
jgi:hypothetical protein